MKKLTVNQIKEVAKNNPYFLLRHQTGGLVGINAKVVGILKKAYNSQQETVWISFIPCDFNEYLNHKVGFIK